MRVKTISYGFTKNLGNYQTSRLDVTIEIEENDNPEEKVQELKKWVHEQIEAKEDKDNGTIF